MTRKFFRNAGVLAAAQIVAKLKGFVLLPLLTAHFGPVSYGAWAQVVVLVGLAPPVIMLGTDSAVMRFLPGTDQNDQLRTFTGWLIWLAGLGGMICLVLALLRVPVAELFFGQTKGYERFVPLAAAAIWAALLVYVAGAWFRIRNQAGWFASITLAQAAVSIVATFIMLVAHQGVYQLVLYSLIGDLVISAVLLTRILRHGTTRPDFSHLRGYIRFGLPLLPAGYAVWALNWLDRIFLINYRTLADIGVYSVAYNLAYLVIQTVVNPIYAMYPNVAAELYNTNNRPGVQRLFERTAGVILVLVLPAVAGSALLGGDLLHVLTPSSFSAAAPVISVVMGGYLCFLLAAYYETTFALVRKQYLATVTVVIAFVVNLILNFALIPPFGYVGAGIATSAAFVAQLAVAIVMAQRLRALRTPFRYVFRVLAASGLMALVVAGVLALVNLGATGRLVVGTLAGVAVYVVLCLVMRLIPPEAIGYAKDLVRGRRRGGLGAALRGTEPGRDGEGERAEAPVLPPTPDPGVPAGETTYH
jgi:O-antigen/teichoic acid export membrane protein